MGLKTDCVSSTACKHLIDPEHSQELSPWKPDTQAGHLCLPSIPYPKSKGWSKPVTRCCPKDKKPLHLFEPWPPPQSEKGGRAPGDKQGCLDALGRMKSSLLSLGSSQQLAPPEMTGPEGMPQPWELSPQHCLSSGSRRRVRPAAHSTHALAFSLSCTHGERYKYPTAIYTHPPHHIQIHTQIHRQVQTHTTCSQSRPHSASHHASAQVWPPLPIL